MNVSSPGFKALAVATGLSFWFFIITSALGGIPIGYVIIFIAVVFSLMQILSSKVSKVLDIFASYNTKIFLGILFVTVISLYGILFKVLQIDLLRLKQQTNSYWLEMDKLQSKRILKQY